MNLTAGIGASAGLFGGASVVGTAMGSFASPMVVDPCICFASSGDEYSGGGNIPKAPDSQVSPDPTKGSGLLASTRADFDLSAWVSKIKAELSAYGKAHDLEGLESRVTFGLDPAGMLAVKETHALASQLADALGASMDAVTKLTNEMHVGAVWQNAAALNQGTEPAIQVWSILGDIMGTEEDLDEAGFRADYKKLIANLLQALTDPTAAAQTAHQNTISAAQNSNVYIEGGVAISDNHKDTAAMAIMGHTRGIIKAGSVLLVFAGSPIDYSVLEGMGLHHERREDKARGVVADFYVDTKGAEIAKRNSPTFAVVLNGDIEVAKALARTVALPATASYEEIENRIPVVRAMQGYDQRSDFHSLTLDGHTREVVRHLEANPFVQAHPQKDLILLAGKLHDIGKMSPDGQQVDSRNPEKRKYVDHEKESERLVRELLPKYFNLSTEDQEFVAVLVGLHASALNLVNNFQTNNQPEGKHLGAYDDFLSKVEPVKGNASLEDTMRIVFAINRADKMAGYNEASDKNDPKVRSIIEKSEKQVAALDGLEKALPALIAAIQGRRSGDNNAGIVLIDGTYYYNHVAPKEEKKIEIPAELEQFRTVLGDKIEAVATVYPRLKLLKEQGKAGALQNLVQGVLRNKLGLNDEVIAAILETFESIC
ncbi:MAG: HD domain-containing protein [Pseudomonadota bacterium]